MDIRSALASQGYATSTKAAQPADTAKEAVKSFAETLAEGEQAAKSAMTGGADPHSLVQALAQTELAVEAAVTVRDKVVEAYQEILRMPV